jgi:hypothetical protein
VREAIEERRFDDANVYAGRTAKVLNDYAARLDAARAKIEGKLRGARCRNPSPPVGEGGRSEATEG